MPVSGLQGHNLMVPMPEGMCPWYRCVRCKPH
jgi:translation elongation factor EF-1alpha